MKNVKSKTLTQPKINEAMPKAEPKVVANKQSIDVISTKPTKLKAKNTSLVKEVSVTKMSTKEVKKPIVNATVNMKIIDKKSVDKEPVDKLVTKTVDKKPVAKTSTKKTGNKSVDSNESKLTAALSLIHI